VGAGATSNRTLSWPGAVTNEDLWADSSVYSSGEYAYTSPTGLAYVQVDLGAVYSVDKVKVWHYAADGRTYHATKTQVSANGSTWTTVFDSAVSGEYAETAAGKTHSFAAQGVRYVRDYLNGSTAGAYNHWVEIEAWGTRTTLYGGPHYEWSVEAGAGTSYYYAGASRVAMRRAGVLYYLLTDHLGGTHVMANASGAKVSETRYRAYGEARYYGPQNGLRTAYRFTGQESDSYINLVRPVRSKPSEIGGG